MYLKKKLIKPCLLLFLILILGVGAVSAADTNSSDNLIGSSVESNISSSNELVLEDSNNNSLSDLQSLIDKDTNGTINLDQDYVYDSKKDTNYTYGVTVNKDLIINGNGYSLNGNNGSSLLNVFNSTLVLNDLNFINGNCMDDDLNDSYVYVGCALGVVNSNLTINNCKFLNNSINGYGGAIFSLNSSLNIIDSKFQYNQAILGGGIYSKYSNLTVTGCDFYKNKAISAAAIYQFDGILNIIDSELRYNNATNYGGAIVSKGILNINDSTLEGNKLTMNNTTTFGGAIYALGILNMNNSKLYSNNASNGSAIFAQDATLNINCSDIITNEDLNNSALITGSNSILNISYSRIMGNASNYIILNNNSTGNLDYNWWGINSNPANLVKLDNSSKLFINYWIILDWELNPLNLTVGDDLNVTLNLNQYTDGNKTYKLKNHLTNVPVRIDYSYSNGYNDYIYAYVTSDKPNPVSTHQLLYSGNLEVSALLGNQVLSQNITVNQLTNKTSIVITPAYAFNIKESFNDYIGYLKDYQGKFINNRNISLNLTRLSDGAWKVYNVSTQYDEYILSINLDPGKYSINASFQGDEDYNPSSSYNEFIVVDVKISTADLTMMYNSKNNFTGNLTTNNGTPIANGKVIINILRISDGVSKDYTVVSNSTGGFSLPINLYSGNYFITTYYDFGKYESYDDYNYNLLYVNNDTMDNRTITFIHPMALYMPDVLMFALYDNEFNGIADVNLSINLVRLSDGANKTYDMLNLGGVQYINIELVKGDYSYTVIFNGTSIYQPSMYKGNFTIDKFNNII